MSRNLPKSVIEFTDFLNKESHYEDLLMVRQYRREACKTWEAALDDLTLEKGNENFHSVMMLTEALEEASRDAWRVARELRCGMTKTEAAQILDAVQENIRKTLADVQSPRGEKVGAVQVAEIRKLVLDWLPSDAVGDDFKARLICRVDAALDDSRIIDDEIVEAMVLSLRNPFPIKSLLREGNIKYWRWIMRNALSAANDLLNTTERR